jgi:hypothetical protein
MHDEVISVWDTACSIDPTLSLRRKDLPALLKKNVRATPYSRARLFSQMAEGEVSLFANLSVPVRGNSPAKQAQSRHQGTQQFLSSFHSD